MNERVKSSRVVLWCKLIGFRISAYLIATGILGTVRRHVIQIPLSQRACLFGFPDGRG